MNVRINQLIYNLVDAVVDQEIEIDNERQGRKIAGDLLEQIVVTITDFIEEQKKGRKAK